MTDWTLWCWPIGILLIGQLLLTLVDDPDIIIGNWWRTQYCWTIVGDWWCWRTDPIDGLTPDPDGWRRTNCWPIGIDWPRRTCCWRTVIGEKDYWPIIDGHDPDPVTIIGQTPVLLVCDGQLVVLTQPGQFGYCWPSWPSVDGPQLLTQMTQQLTNIVDWPLASNLVDLGPVGIGIVMTILLLLLLIIVVIVWPTQCVNGRASEPRLTIIIGIGQYC